MMTSEDRKLAESISNVTRSKLQINASQKIETCRLSTAQTRPCAAPPSSGFLQTSHLTACKTWASFRNAIASVTESSEKRSWPG